MSFTIDLNTFSDTQLAKLLTNLTRVIASRLGKSKAKRESKTADDESLTSRLDRPLSAPKENDFPTGDSEPYPRVSRKQLDRELDEMVAEREGHNLSSQFGKMRF